MMFVQKRVMTVNIEERQILKDYTRFTRYGTITDMFIEIYKSIYVCMHLCIGAKLLLHSPCGNTIVTSTRGITTGISMMIVQYEIQRFRHSVML